MEDTFDIMLDDEEIQGTSPEPTIKVSSPLKAGPS